jgi:hypothetical protein
MELASGGLEICRIQGETNPNNHRPCLWSWRSQVGPKTWLEHQLLYSFSLGEFIPTRFFSCKAFLTRQQVQYGLLAQCTLFSYPFSTGFLGEVFNEAWTGHIVHSRGSVVKFFLSEQWIMNGRWTVTNKWNSKAQMNSRGGRISSHPLTSINGGSRDDARWENGREKSTAYICTTCWIIKSSNPVAKCIPLWMFCVNQRALAF